MGMFKVLGRLAVCTLVGDGGGEGRGTGGGEGVEGLDHMMVVNFLLVCLARL